MKKKDWILAAGVCCIALLVWLVYQFIIPGDNSYIRITVYGEVYGEYPLFEDREISIGETNVCRIQDGTVRMIQADCPDQFCVHQNPVGDHGGTIVCLPNRVVIEAVPEGTQTEDTLDAVVR